MTKYYLDNDMIKKAIEYFENSREKFCDSYLNSVPKDSIGYKITLIEREYFNIAIEAMEQRDLLSKIRDEIRDEIEKQEKWILQAGCNTYNVDIALDAIKSILTDLEVKP